MAVDLGDLIESLKREVNAPGEEVFTNATDDDYLGHLADAFWEARLDGMLEGYSADEDGVVLPLSGTTDLTRDLQQLVVLYAGIRIARNHLRNLKTVFRAKAGPVEFETQQAATVLVEILKELKDRRKLVLARLSDLGVVNTYYIDAITARTEGIDYGDTWWIN